MSSEFPSSPESAPPLVAMLVSESLKRPLRGAVQLDPLRWMELDAALEDEEIPAAIVVEMAVATDRQLRRVLADPQLLGTTVIVVGSTAPSTRELIRTRPRVHHLESDGGAERVGQLVAHCLSGDDGYSEPSPPFSPPEPSRLSPPAPSRGERPSFPERPQSDPAGPLTRNGVSPTNLFPSSPGGTLTPSTRPSMQPPGWTIPPGLLETGDDEMAKTPPGLSPELEGLLASAERRINEQLYPRDSSSAPPDALVQIPISQEIHTALTDPIEMAEPEGDWGRTPAGTDARTTNEGRTLTRASRASELATPARLTPHPPQAHPITVRPVTRRQPSTVPPSLATDQPGRELTTGREHTVPKAPPVPRDVWSQLSPSPERLQVPAPDESPNPPSYSAKDLLSGLTPPRTRGKDDLQSSPTVPPLRSDRKELDIPNLLTERVRARHTDPSLVDPYSERTHRHTSRDSSRPPISPPTAGRANVPLSSRPPASSERKGPEVMTPLPAPESAVAASPLKDESVRLSGDVAVDSLALAVHERRSGALTYETEAGVIRRVVLRDGDFVTAASSSSSESLVQVLVSRGMLDAGIGEHLAARLPSFGRRAGAALVADGYLAQDQLWPVLRAHAEEIVGRVLKMTAGTVTFERTIPGRLGDEPSVFGGATGSEVLLELLKRVVSPGMSLERIGGQNAELARGPRFFLLEECALREADRVFFERAEIYSVGLGLQQRGQAEEFACTLYGLVKLGVLQRPAPTPNIEPRQPPTADPLDERALRSLIARRRALVEDGDYFSLLGVTSEATGYDVRRAYLELKRTLSADTILSPRTLDLRDDVELILDVATEAYEVLKDTIKRERYRRALLSSPVA